VRQGRECVRGAEAGERRPAAKLADPAGNGGHRAGETRSARGVRVRTRQWQLRCHCCQSLSITSSTEGDLAMETTSTTTSKATARPNDYHIYEGSGDDLAEQLDSGNRLILLPD